MEEEDILRVKVSSHLVQVYDTRSTSSRLSTTSIWVETHWSGGEELVTHPCPAESKKGAQEAEENAVLLCSRSDKQWRKSCQLEIRHQKQVKE
jgi:hypothetical protein